MSSLTRRIQRKRNGMGKKLGVTFAKPDSGYKPLIDLVTAHRLEAPEVQS